MVDQNTRSVTNIFMLLAVLAMAALAYSVGMRSGSDSDYDLLAPGLQEQLNDLRSVTVTAGENKLIARLAKNADDNNWGAENAGGYPANVSELRRILMLLADAQLIEQKTANADYYERLGVKAMDDPEASGLQLDIEGPSDTISIIVGDSNINGEYTYVRRSDETTSWLVSGNINPGRQLRDWLDRVIVDLSPDRIKQVTISHPDGESVVISKDSVETPSYTLANLAAGETLGFEGVLNAVTGVPTRLELENVIARDDFESTDDTPVITSYSTFDGLVVEFSIYAADETNIVQLKTSATKADAEPEAEEINARTGNWLFEVPGYKAAQLTKRKTDLLNSD